jgi:aspartate/methionine/tyrosine aminotransferase
VSPNNPTGHVLTTADLEALLDLGLPLLCDEVFEAYPLRPCATPARLTDARRGLVFSLRGLSKECALPQLKLAWTCVSGEEARVAEAMRRLELLGDTFLSVGAPVQHALGDLLAATEVTRAAILSRARENVATLTKACVGSAVSVLPVEAGWYAVLRLPETRSDEAWAFLFLEKCGIYVHPGAFFGFGRGAYVVLSLLVPPQELASAAAALVETVERDV